MLCGQDWCQCLSKQQARAAFEWTAWGKQSRNIESKPIQPAMAFEDASISCIYQLECSKNHDESADSFLVGPLQKAWHHGHVWKALQAWQTDQMHAKLQSYAVWVVQGVPCSNAWADYLEDN